MIDRERETERERGRDTGRGRSRLHARSPTRDSIPDSRITPWAKGRRSTAEPLRRPSIHFLLHQLWYMRFLPGASPPPSYFNPPKNFEK